jgi:hypothetical protein
VLTDRHSAGGREDRERIDGARQAAEDLFKPKRDVAPVAEATSAPAASVEQQSPRSPRIILIQPVTRTSITVEAEPPAKPTPDAQGAIVQKRMFQIPESHFGRIRALTDYGMTPRQVAELYKIPVDEVEEILSRQGSRRKL